jgi:hypothetical protein
MGVKAEISWKRKDPEGNRREVYARHVGSRWLFFAREKRGERWEPLEHPPLQDWLELLDAVERRIHRRLARPEEAQRLRLALKERFPEAHQ